MLMLAFQFCFHKPTNFTSQDPSHHLLTCRLFVCFVVRAYLQRNISQEVSDVQQQHYCPEHLRTTTTSAWSPQASAPLPVWRSQVDQVTGNGTQIRLSSAEDRAADTPMSSPGPPVRLLLKTRDDCCLPSTPHPGGRRRLPCSLPCSPLLGSRHWRSPPSSPSPPVGPSRLWVEAALQRSKNIGQTKPHRPPPCSPQVRQEGVSSRWGETEEDGEEVEWMDDEKEDSRQANHMNIAGIRLSDTIIFRPITSPSVCGGEAGEEEEEEESDLLCWGSEMSRYCLLTPCICFRYETVNSGDLNLNNLNYFLKAPLVSSKIS